MLTSRLAYVSSLQIPISACSLLTDAQSMNVEPGMDLVVTKGTTTIETTATTKTTTDSEMSKKSSSSVNALPCFLAITILLLSY